MTIILKQKVNGLKSNRVWTNPQYCDLVSPCLAHAATINKMYSKICHKGKSGVIPQLAARGHLELQPCTTHTYYMTLCWKMWFISVLIWDPATAILLTESTKWQTRGQNLSCCAAGGPRAHPWTPVCYRFSSIHISSRCCRGKVRGHPAGLIFAEKLGGSFLFLVWLCQPGSCSQNQLLFFPVRMEMVQMIWAKSNMKDQSCSSSLIVQPWQNVRMFHPCRFVSKHEPHSQHMSCRLMLVDIKGCRNVPITQCWPQRQNLWNLWYMSQNL